MFSPGDSALTASAAQFPGANGPIMVPAVRVLESIHPQTDAAAAPCINRMNLEVAEILEGIAKDDQAEDATRSAARKTLASVLKCPSLIRTDDHVLEL